MERKMLRQPAVAGMFYPRDKARLTATVDEFLAAKVKIGGAVAAVSPHAGYEYSGPAAGALFAAIEIPPTVVILGPNHRGVGAAYGISDSGAWQTPLGDAAIDEVVASGIRKHANFVKSDSASHAYEHSIEVQIPFLQRRRASVKIVPLCIGEHNFARLVELGAAIADAVKDAGVEALVLASSDMTHYESADSAARKDGMAIERMLALDEEGLWQTVGRHGISMCGVAPAVSAIVAAKALGAVEGRLVKYTNSGDATGDRSEVVGYASLAFVREAQ